MADPSTPLPLRPSAAERERVVRSLRDLGSRNGTRVNGLRVLEETEVRPGDLVSFGGARYRLGSPR